MNLHIRPTVRTPGSMNIRPPTGRCTIGFVLIALAVSLFLTACGGGGGGGGGTAQAQTEPTILTGYILPRSLSDDKSLRNVLVFKQDFGTASNVFYQIRMLYQGSANSQLSVDGVPTTFSFIGEFPGVTTASDGVTLVSLRNFREGRNSTTEIRHNLERSTIDPISKAITITRDTTFRIETECFTPSFENVFRHCYSQEESIFDNSILFITDVSRVQSRIAGPLTVNGMTFNDVILESRPRDNRNRYRAQGVGVILVSRGDLPSELIWYRIDGIRVGNLAGTPFAAGGPAAGIFFNP